MPPVTRLRLCPPRLAIGLLLFLVLVPSLVLGAASAETAGKHGRWGLGLESGLLKLGEGNWDYANVDRLSGLTINRDLGPSWNLQFSLHHGHFSPGIQEPEQAAGWTRDRYQSLFTVVTQPSLNLEYRFIPDFFVSPQVGVGLGWTSWKVVSAQEENIGLFPDQDPVEGFDIDGDPTVLEGGELTLSFRLGFDLAVSRNFELNAYGVYQGLGGGTDNAGLSSIWGADHVDVNTGLYGGFVGLTWWFGSADADGDGVADDRDLCPGQVEDHDGFNDLDGCPDPDNDQDGILDGQDACPNDSEDFDGFQDQDGCPDLDNDQDGVRDGRDACPDSPEDLDGHEDADGCPDPDNDQDGVPDTADKCPFTPPDARVDENGCEIRD